MHFSKTFYEIVVHYLYRVAWSYQAVNIVRADVMKFSFKFPLESLSTTRSGKENGARVWSGEFEMTKVLEG